MRYIIKDWANNICFNEISFKTFDNAWEFIYNSYKNNPNADLNGTFDDYFVELEG